MIRQITVRIIDWMKGVKQLPTNAKLLMLQLRSAVHACTVLCSM